MSHYGHNVCYRNSKVIQLLVAFFFHEKRKKKFILLPWQIGDFVFRNVNKIDEFACHSNNLNLIYFERLRGFDPIGIFLEHLLAVGFNNSFIQTHLNEYRDNDDTTTSLDARDLETLQSTTELYKQQGKGPSEKSVQSPTTTPKSMTSRSIAPMTQASKKETHNYSNGGGDKNPPRGKIDSSHKLHVRKKRKNVVGQAEEYEIEIQDMELETDMDNVSCNVDNPKDAIHHSPPMEIAETKFFYEDESFVFQSIVFYSEYKHLIIEKRDVRNKKGKSHSEINLRNMQLSQISRLHRETVDALDDSIGGIEVENARLKDQLKELEEALIPIPFLASPLAITMPTTPTAKLKGSSNLLTSCRGYVENNIKKIMKLIT
jgi:hypothetical protein